jgi:hypothetical protein
VRTEPAPLVDTQKLRGSDRPVEFRLVPTWDGLYTPIASCLPAGEGPHAVVVLAYGNGGGGLPWVRDAVRDRDLVVEQVLAAGYGAVWIDYRTEVELGYHRGGPLTRDVRSGVRSSTGARWSSRTSVWSSTTSPLAPTSTATASRRWVAAMPARCC